MIDNPALTAALHARLNAALPLPALITTHLAGVLVKEAPDTLIPKACQVVRVHNLGDEGGIVCELSIPEVANSNRVFLTSITHLDFDRRLPLAREIAAYAKRVKKLRRQSGQSPL